MHLILTCDSIPPKRFLTGILDNNQECLASIANLALRNYVFHKMFLLLELLLLFYVSICLSIYLN